MYKVLKLLSIAIITFSSVNASAFTYYEDDPIVFTWQTSSGKWRACGPIQCTSASSGSEKQAIYYITDKGHGKLKWKGDYGKCNAYIGSGSIGAGDYSPKKVIRLAKKYC